MKYTVEKESLDAVAEAIRTRGGASTLLLFPSGFVSAIQNIPQESPEISLYGAGATESFANGPSSPDDADKLNLLAVDVLPNRMYLLERRLYTVGTDGGLTTAGIYPAALRKVDGEWKTSAHNPPSGFTQTLSFTDGAGMATGSDRLTITTTVGYGKRVGITLFPVAIITEV